MIKSLAASFVGLGVALSVIFYIYDRHEAAKPKPQVLSHSQRIAAAQAVVDKGPVITSHQTRHGEVLLVKVPKMPEHGTRVDYLECLVWRDHEFRHTSMSCPSEASFDPSEIIRDTE